MIIWEVRHVFAHDERKFRKCICIAHIWIFRGDRYKYRKSENERFVSRKFRNDEHVFGEFILKENNALLIHTMLENKRCRCTSIWLHSKEYISISIYVSFRSKMTKIPSWTENEVDLFKNLLFIQSFFQLSFLYIILGITIRFFSSIFGLYCISNYVPVL